MCRAIANFSVTFSIISVLTGLSTTYSTGLTYGGTVTMVYGWPIVGMLTMVVGASMAEICSAFPTSGGLYFWSAKLCGNEWGPFASWLTGWYLPSPLTIYYFTLFFFLKKVNDFDLNNHSTKLWLETKIVSTL